MTAIYAVYAITNHEGGAVMCAFANEADAIACMAACEAHEAERPRTPKDILETDENNREWAEYWDADQAWGARHPVGGHDWMADYYSVAPIELHSAALTPKEAP